MYHDNLRNILELLVALDHVSDTNVEIAVSGADNTALGLIRVGSDKNNVMLPAISVHLSNSNDEDTDYVITRSAPKKGRWSTSRVAVDTILNAPGRASILEGVVKLHLDEWSPILDSLQGEDLEDYYEEMVDEYRS